MRGRTGTFDASPARLAGAVANCDGSVEEAADWLVEETDRLNDPTPVRRD